jgi:hypothetical protein
VHGDDPYDPELFRREILPRLRTVRLSEIVEATGMSKAFASQVRAGKFTPHVSTWTAFAGLVEIEIKAPSHLPDTLTEEVASHAI